MPTAEPEREMVRTMLPLSVPVLAVALLAGGLVGGRDAASSAALGVIVVFANFIAYAYSLVYAARISLVVLYAVALGGFIVRLGIVVGIILGLQQLSWFSVVAFVAALVPATIVLLAFEIKMVSGRMQADLWTIPAGPEGARR
ncbi:MAG: hypothetical protein M3P43_05125 [Actinomycetota bacterium]|nr:hypothetical protein [Actinomycetota bacterium]